MSYYLGIDLGTSGVKVMAASPEGTIHKEMAPYREAAPWGWLEAMETALGRLWQKLSPTQVAAVSLSSQVGTYLTDDGEVIGWQSAAGAQELSEIKSQVTQAAFLSEIGMAHPDLISYPLPRLLYVKRHHPNAKRVCMPKEFLMETLTGESITDPFSYRGLCHPSTRRYSAALLDRFGIDLSLPPVADPTDLGGRITPAAALRFGIPEGTPVYPGCNDFFAGLLGMGVLSPGTVFELSGTSEHFGAITSAPVPESFVSGLYFEGCATYGGTKSSGSSINYAIREFDIGEVTTRLAFEKAPIFLPYLAGERAPIFDETARGVFFGISPETRQSHMAYAVMEGVVFSLYHIAARLGLSCGRVPAILVGGGAAMDLRMNKMKASLWNTPVIRARETDSSALGACILAMAGHGVFPTLGDAVSALVAYDDPVEPDPALGERLRARFEIYQDLYPSLKGNFKAFSKL